MRAVIILAIALFFVFVIETKADRPPCKDSACKFDAKVQLFLFPVEIDFIII